jgi:spermidine synthase
MSRSEQQETPAPAGGKVSATGRWLLGAYGVSGAAALIYEVAWMRVLGEMLGSTAYASGTMLAAFMTGLGLGSLLGARIAARTRHPLRAAARAELAVAAASVIALACLVYLPGAFFDLLTSARLSGAGFLGLQFAASFAIMLLPTIAMGLTYPLIMEAVAKRGHFGRWSGMLYTANTAGAIVGSLAAGFVLIPLLRVKGSLIVAALLSLAAAALLAWLATRTEKAPALWRSPEPYIAVLALVAIAFVPAPPPYTLGVTAIDRFRSASDFAATQSKAKVLFDDDGIYSRVSVLQYVDGTRVLRNGALTEGSNDDPDRRTPALLAALPMASAQTSESALVVGLGTGYTPLTTLQLGVGHTTTVEINPAVLTASQYFAGKQLEADPRWSVVIDDARAHILTNPDTYDVITSEPSWPLSASVAPLFTREFMAAAKSRLTQGGVFCQWLPNYLLTDADVRMMYKTMRQVFPRVDVWAVSQPGMDEGELILIGSEGLDPRPQKQIGLQVLSDTKPLGITSAMFHPYIADPALETALTDPAVPINTDDHTYLEYRVIWNLLTPSAATPGVAQ